LDREEQEAAAIDRAGMPDADRRNSVKSWTVPDKEHSGTIAMKTIRLADWKPMQITEVRNAGLMWRLN